MSGLNLLDHADLRLARQIETRRAAVVSILLAIPYAFRLVEQPDRPCELGSRPDRVANLSETRGRDP